MMSTSSFDSRARVCPRAMATAFWLVAIAAALVAGCQTSSTATDVTAASDVAKCQVTLGTTSAVEATGGTGTVSVTTQPECSWNASSTVNWISSVSPGTGQGTRDVEFRVAPNDGSAAREGDIVVNDSRVRVSQKAACRYSLAPASQTVGAGAGSGSINISAGSECSWTANSDSGWLTLADSVSGRGNGTVSFGVPANSGAERTATVTIGGQRAIVTQTAAGAPGPGPTPGCTYTITPASQDVSAVGGSGSFSVTTQSGCQWSASSTASWLSVSSGASGTGNGSVGFSVAINAGGARSGTITVAGRAFTVNQAAALNLPTCTYSVSPGDVKIGKDGGNKTIKVSTASGCTWTASSNTSWITITAGASGSGNGNVSISIAKNTSTIKRTGTITVAGQTVTVEQDK